ncbi:MAG TPA: phosphotransferase [Pseudomonadales bacterium]
MPRPNGQTVSVVPEPDPRELETLVDDYALGELVRHWPATGGIENSNHFLVTRQARQERCWVLTVLERPPYAGDALVSLLDACVAAGLPVPAVVRTRHGQPFAELGGKRAMLCPRLPGRHVYNPTERQVQAVGRFLARFHRAALAADLALPAYPRGLDWLRRHAEQCRPHLPYSAAVLMRDTCAQLGRALARKDVAALPQGAIHADLFRDNVLFNEWGLSGVLDFHHAARGFLIYDVAIAANDWCTGADGALDPERTLALLGAYHRLRPLTRQELWYFPLFALYGALAFWISRQVVADAQRRGEPVRANNPAEFHRIVRHHAAHFFYLDERLLEIGGG